MKFFALVKVGEGEKTHERDAGDENSGNQSRIRLGFVAHCASSQHSSSMCHYADIH